jgi:hypothetical protein
MMYTATYVTPPELFKHVAADIGRFGRRLRVGTSAAPRLIVPELSPAGRWHVHVGLPDELPSAVVEAAWGLGGVRGPKLKYAYSEEAHALLAGYVTKDFDRTPRGQRRYFAAQGMRPKVTTFQARTEAEALAIAIEVFEAEPTWMSDQRGASVFIFPSPRRDTNLPTCVPLADGRDLSLAG